MHRTTFGETHKKTKVLNRKAVSEFRDASKKAYGDMASRSVIYENNTIIKDSALNYLNVFYDDKTSNQLNFLIKREFSYLDSVFPFLGDVFIDCFFDNENLNFEKDVIFDKSESENVLFSINDSNVKSIIKKLIENTSLEYSVEPIGYPGSEILLRKQEDIFINLDYDYTYLGSKNHHSMNDFKFILIDGFIESVGEIHHLMFQAAESKIPHVIFCFGLSPEVKHVILENNKKGITEVFPVDMNFDENTINILSDLGTIFNSEVISANKGQTISQEVRKTLKTGRQITFYKHGLAIKPLIDEECLSSHRRYLKKRIAESDNETNRELLLNRLKSMSTKILKIYIPEKLISTQNFNRQLDYGLRLISRSSHVLTKIVNSKTGRYFYVPKKSLSIVDEKVESLKNTYNNIEKMVINR